MYDIRQFKPTLYVLVMLGITGFALAGQMPGLWLGAMGLIGWNAWKVYRGRFRPLPRLLTNLITLLVLLWIVAQIARLNTTPILLIGQFLVVLQVIKLYEQRGNRDYAQLLVLSLLLVVAASINTASLLFGILLIVYLFISLYCCLLFHLKVETDTARTQFAIPPEKVNPALLRQDQRFLSRSMRRLTGLVSAVSVGMAVVVFLFFPRGTGAGMLGPLQFRPAQTMTGFSDQVNFQRIARITQNTAVAAYVWVWKNDSPVSGGEPLLLRGTALDVYDGDGREGGVAWQWSRSPSEWAERNYLVAPEHRQILEDAEPIAEGADHWRQRVQLEPSPSNVLFAMAGVASITPQRETKLRYSPRDEVLQNIDSVFGQTVVYDVVSSGRLGRKIDRAERATSNNELGERRRTRSRIDPKIRDYAMKVAGDLIARRPPGAIVDEADEKIAEAFEAELRGEDFSYTLDLTDAGRLGEREDPVVAFLYRLKRGHCEYYAGAMTLLCQSAGLQARMVVGFKTPPDEFNRIGGFYTVRQSHAHAWVEVLTPGGWKTFDPTSGRDPRQAPATGVAGLWRQVKHLFNYLEYRWAASVVAYDSSSRDNMLESLSTRLDQTAVGGSQWFSGLSEWLNKPLFWSISIQLLAGAMGLMAMAMIGAIAWFFIERWKLRRRAARIGISSLPSAEQLRLAKQLGFYDEMMRILERHRIARGRHLTPAEFGETLSYLPAEAFDTVRRLTRLFYRIRFGGQTLPAAQQRRVARAVQRLSPALATAFSASPAGAMPD